MDSTRTTSIATLIAIGAGPGETAFVFAAGAVVGSLMLGPFLGPLPDQGAMRAYQTVMRRFDGPVTQSDITALGVTLTRLLKSLP